MNTAKQSLGGWFVKGVCAPDNHDVKVNGTLEHNLNGRIGQDVNHGGTIGIKPSPGSREPLDFPAKTPLRLCALPGLHLRHESAPPCRTWVLPDRRFIAAMQARHKVAAETEAPPAAHQLTREEAERLLQVLSAALSAAGRNPGG